MESWQDVTPLITLSSNIRLDKRSPPDLIIAEGIETSGADPRYQLGKKITKCHESKYGNAEGS
jgi:hypothetical protein